MILLTITLAMLAILSYYLNNRNLISPSVLFSVSFFSCALIALFNKNKWNLNLNSKTYFLISGSILEFILVSFIVKKVISSINFSNTGPTTTSSQVGGRVLTNTWGLLIVQLCMVMYIIRDLREKTQVKNIFQAASILNQTSLPTYIGKPLSLSSLSNLFIAFIVASGLFTGFIFLRGLIIDKNFKSDCFFNLLVSIIAPFLTGSRGNTIYILIALIIFSYLILLAGNKLNLKNQKKFVFVALIILVFVIYLLPVSANLLGRRMDDLSDYIGIYIGAQIKNLNDFIANNHVPLTTSIFGEQTFFTIIPLISKIFGLGIQPYKLNLPFQAVGFHSLGNVYTTFYPWLYDFGFIGVFVLTFIMSLICEIVYMAAMRKLKATNQLKPTLSILLYGYLGSFIALSFFSNKFYEGINSTLVYMIISWIVLIQIFVKKEN
ncbi:O-antigen polymerase [Lactobacillus crispatus]|uniref:O-antigen polymerase n=1 Tax=Lactobacillus crispatus TaxID=47770 RepID=UPI003D6AB280